MTKQEAFDRVWKWFVVEGHGKSRLEDGGPFITQRCVYRGPNGLRCAAGVLMPDAMYDPIFDKAGGMDNDEVLSLLARRLHIGKPFLYSLQQCHDQCGSDETEDGFTVEIRRSLIRLAERHNLEVPSL